eukprot:14598607-Ditylum_brightwellii.AAC.1
MHLKGMSKRKISVISTYRVCKNKVESTGPLTAWMQQWQVLKEKGVRKPDPRHQFLKDLSNTVGELTDKGHKVVLSLDANKDLGDK